jgi:hypothetical protein
MALRGLSQTGVIISGHRPLKLKGKENKINPYNAHFIYIDKLQQLKLKVVCNENQGGSGRWHKFRIGLRPWRLRFVSRLILLSSLILSNFRFRPSKAKSIGNVLTNRQSAALRSNGFFLLYNAHCLLTQRIILRS